MTRTVKTIRYLAVDDWTAAKISSVLLLIPFLFLLENFFEYIIHADAFFIAYVTDIFKSLDRKLVFIGPLLFIVAPIIASFLNVFSVISLGYDREEKVVDIKIHLKWMNIFFLFIAIMSLTASGLYMFLENFGI